VAGLYDHQGNSNLDLAFARYSWRFKVNRLLEGLQKPTIQQIQQHLKEVCFIDYLAFGSILHS
jgi:histone demethylase JARID1